MITRKKSSVPDFDKLYQSIDDSFKLEDIKIRILVFGPDLSKSEPGSELRNFIIANCKSDSYVVVLSEYDEIQELYSKILGPIHDLCKMEYHLATGKDKNHGHDFIDGIIILPDSAGSFIELGMFAIAEKIHNKILILFNNQYEATISDSFVGKGAKLAFDNGHARTKIIDYNDSTKAWEEVSKFLELIRSTKRWRTFIKN